MSNHKFTPGPWISGQKHTDQIANTFSVYDEKGNLIHAGLSPRSYNHITKETAEANAKLIAAAPEMLDALLKFKKEFEEKGKAKDSDFYYSFCELVLKATE